MISRGRKFGNDTIDVANKGCWEPYDTLACLRMGFLTTATTVTLILIILKIIKYHVYRHTQLHHYAIFYTSALECVICTTSFLVGNRYPQIELAACFLKLVVFVLVCHLLWSQAARSSGCLDVVQRVVNPILCLYLLYCVTVALMGMVDVVSSWIECQRPYWLMLSIADFLAVELFSTAVLFIVHRTGAVLSLACIKQVQYRDLWSIVLVYQVSAIMSLTYDIVMKLGSSDIGCSGVFSHTQLFYSVVVSIFCLAKFLVPLWTLLCVFQPFEDRARASEVALATSYNMVGFMDMTFPDTDSSVHSSPSNSPALQKFAVSNTCVEAKLPSFLTAVPALGLSTISEESGGLEFTPSLSVEWTRTKPCM